MDFNAFTAGIKPGGLRNQNEIKLLVCYLLSSFENGLTKEEVVAVLQENSFANYFEVISAFDELSKDESIKLSGEDSSKYLITERGKTIATQLEVNLPSSLREQAISSMVRLMTKIKLLHENKVDIRKCNEGYNVSCSISGGDYDLMSFNIFVPDVLQAELIKKNFHENPTLIYKSVLALVTKNIDIVKDALSEIEK